MTLLLSSFCDLLSQLESLFLRLADLLSVPCHDHDHDDSDDDGGDGDDDDGDDDGDVDH